MPEKEDESEVQPTVTPDLAELQDRRFAYLSFKQREDMGCRNCVKIGIYWMNGSCLNVCHRGRYWQIPQIWCHSM